MKNYGMFIPVENIINLDIKKVNKKSTSFIKYEVIDKLLYTKSPFTLLCSCHKIVETNQFETEQNYLPNYSNYDFQYIFLISSYLRFRKQIDVYENF